MMTNSHRRFIRTEYAWFITLMWSVIAVILLLNLHNLWYWFCVYFSDSLPGHQMNSFGAWNIIRWTPSLAKNQHDKYSMRVSIFGSNNEKVTIEPTPNTKTLSDSYSKLMSNQFLVKWISQLSIAAELAIEEFSLNVIGRCPHFDC